MKSCFFALLGSAAIASASWTKNLNYRSPSEHHPFMGISIHNVVKRNDAKNPMKAKDLKFTHGVASGDPYSDSVILWTRCSPTIDDDHSNVTVSGTVPVFNHLTEEYVRMSTSPVCVNWRISTRPDMGNAVNSGKLYTSSDIDYTVKLEAGGLEPFTQYYYQFNVCGSSNFSPIGSAKTAPRPDDKLTQLKLAVYSCSNYNFGFFNAFGNSARKHSVDFVVHLGDFIYEYAEGAYGWGYSIDRIPKPNVELRTLYDYRRRHASYRADPDTLLSAQTYTWISVWDDHEIADNVWRDGVADQNNTLASYLQYDVEFGGEHVSFDQRKMNAVRAFFEFHPVRLVDMDDNLRIWRSFNLGTLVDLVMLDTRNYDRSITDLYWNTEYIKDISNDAGRSMMGARQESWFYNQLSESNDRGAAWRLIGSQTVFGRENESLALGNNLPLDYDAWDGYMANKNRTLEHLYNNNISNNIFMAGDSHMSWVNDLVYLGNHAYDPATGVGAIGVEFAGSAVSSPCPYGQNITQAKADAASAWLVAHNPELQWQDVYYRGYYELIINYDNVTAQYFGIPSLVQRLPYEVSLANFTVQRDANHLQRPVAGGLVASGALQVGKTVVSNISNDTSHPNGKYFVTQLDTFGYGQTKLGMNGTSY